jgi:hypothetical protein
METDSIMVEFLVHFPPLATGDQGNPELNMMLHHIAHVITHITPITYIAKITITSMYPEITTALIHVY